MMEKSLEVGKEYYFIKFNPDLGFPGGQFNFDNYEVLKGKLVEINDDVFIMKGISGLMELKDTVLFSSLEEAESYRIHLSF